MTDSVNCVAFFDPVNLDMLALTIPLVGDNPATLCGFFVPARRRFLLRGRGLLLHRGRRRRRGGRARFFRGGRFTVRDRWLHVARRFVGRRLRSVETTIIFGGPEDLLHVVLSLRERDVVDELVALHPCLISDPALHAVGTGVVGGQSEV